MMPKEEVLTQEEASNRVAVGMILLLAQRIIAADTNYPETDIRKFLRMRKQHHPYFIEGAGALAEMIDSGEITGPSSIVPALRRLEKSSPSQFTQMMTQVARAIRGLRQTRFEDPHMRLFMRLVSDAFPEDGEILDTWSLKNLMEMAVLRFDPPGPIKTLFRRYKSLPSGLSLESLRIDYVEPGAWFDMASEEKAELQRRLEKVENSYKEFDYSAASEDERRAFFDGYSRQRAQIIAEAGVNQNIIARGDIEPLEVVLRREKNLNPDGPTSYVLERAVERLIGTMEYARERGQKVNPYRKGLTLLKKAKSFDSVIRVLQSLQDSRLIYDEDIKATREDIERVKLNKAVKSGKPLVPLTFKPMTEPEFQEEFNSGEIRFDESYSDEQKRELLGRVGRSIRDLEMIFGKGFCGKGPRKLRFTFEGGDGTGSGALASYFQWEGGGEWNPRVKFGRNFEGLLAHELSHYIEEVIDWRFREVTGQTRSDKGYTYSPSNIFGNTGVDVGYFVSTLDHMESRENSILSQFPELGEFMRAVHATPDYRRWEDKIGSALEMTIPGAIKKVTGISEWDHPEFKGWMSTKFYKSDFPPEIIEQASLDYKKMRGGDDRKLRYYHSTVEIWARMLEQYVYTRLADIGISNPWLTQVTYDPSVMDQFMDQDRFEQEIAPILDRLFDRLKKREIIARIASEIAQKNKQTTEVVSSDRDHGQFIDNDIIRMGGGRNRRMALKIPLRNLPAYIPKIKARLEAYARKSDIYGQIRKLPGFVESTLKENSSLEYYDLSEMLKRMKDGIEFLNVSEGNIRFMFTYRKDFGRHLPKSCYEVAEYIVSGSLVDQLKDDGYYPKDVRFPDETIDDNDLKGLVNAAQAVVGFYQTVEEFKDRVKVLEYQEETLEAKSVETLYHVSINARNIYRNGFSMTMPEKDSGMGLGGSQSTKSNRAGISFTYDRNNAREMYRLLRELHDALKGKMKARIVVDTIERSQNPDAVWEEWALWRKPRWPETPLDVAHLHYLYTFYSKDRTPIWILNVRRGFLPNLAKASASDIGIIVADVNMDHEDVTFMSGEREYRVPPEAVIKIKKLEQ